MSVGLGRIERRVLKVLEWERQHHGGALRHLLDYSSGKRAYQECDSTVTELVDSILYGCTEDDHDYTLNRSDKVYRSLYQSVCRAVRSLERKGLIKTGKGILFWEDGWGYKTVTLTEDRTKHLDTVKTDIGINV
ncbi:hypothetical protein ES708_11389 [subsurface metagenome]